MSKIDITTKATVLANGMLQTAAALNPTLQVVTDNVGNSSQLLLSTTEVQVNSTLRINTNNSEILDIQDAAANNRFNVNRVVQKVNLDFASKPADLTTIVGAIRTATDGTNLVDVATFLENGNIGINQTAPTSKLQIKGSGSTNATTSLLVQDSGGNDKFKIVDSGQIIWQGIIGTSNGSRTIEINDSFSGNSYLAFGGHRFFAYDGSNYNPCLTITGNGSVSQIAVNSATPNVSAVFDVNSTTKGFLPPRMTTAQKNAITTPAAGLVIYDSTLNKLCVRTAGAWETITSI